MKKKDDLIVISTYLLLDVRDPRSAIPYRDYEQTITAKQFFPGSIELSVNRRPLMRRADWDDVDILWGLMLTGIWQLLQSGVAAFSYPDQPINVVFESRDDNMMRLVVDDIDFTVDRKQFCSAAALEAKGFLKHLSGIAPKFRLGSRMDECEAILRHCA